MFEDSVFEGDLICEYLARETSGVPGPHYSDWPLYSASIGNAYTGFVAPPFPTYVQIWLYFLALTPHLLSGITLHFPPHLPRRHCLENRPPQSKTDNHLQNLRAVKVHPHSAMPKGSGAVMYAETFFTISTNASDT